MSDLNKIKHLVILMMENRSFDHYMGSLSLEGRNDVDGLSSPLPTNPDLDGNPIAASPIDDISPGYPDPPHGWGPAHDAYNEGKNDGFVQQYQLAYPPGSKEHDRLDLKIPMGYYTRKTLPVYYSLADTFTLCDHWHGSVLSSTWPNRKYLVSGKRDQDNDTHTLPAWPGFETTPIYDLLEESKNPQTGSKISWKCYFSDLPFMAFWYPFAAKHLRNFRPIWEFVDDCRENTLPDITVIDPAFGIADDHPSRDPRLGQKFVGLVVDALTHSDSWDSSALIITYDENGGFFDHVPPPPCFEGGASEDNPLGFRVPTFVVSPYAKRTNVSHTVFDHTSVIKTISELWKVNFPVKTFGPRWKKAPSIWDDCFDFSQKPIPQGCYSGDPLREINWGTGVHEMLKAEPNPMVSMLERSFTLPELKGIDNRAHVYESLNALEQKVISLKRML